MEVIMITFLIKKAAGNLRYPTAVIDELNKQV